MRSRRPVRTGVCRSIAGMSWSLTTTTGCAQRARRCGGSLRRLPRRSPHRLLPHVRARPRWHARDSPPRRAVADGRRGSGCCCLQRGRRQHHRRGPRHVPDFRARVARRLRDPGHEGACAGSATGTPPGTPFTMPASYPEESVAMSGTHDTETLAEWWDSATGSSGRLSLALPVLRDAGCRRRRSSRTATRDVLLEALFAAGSRLAHPALPGHLRLARPHQHARRRQRRELDVAVAVASRGPGDRRRRSRARRFPPRALPGNTAGVAIGPGLLPRSPAPPLIRFVRDAAVSNVPESVLRHGHCARTPRRARARDRALAFRSRDRLSVLAGAGQDASTSIPLKDVKGYADLDRFGLFEDEWLRGGPVRRWVPKAFADKPIYVFETGGTHRRAQEPHRHRRFPHRLLELFSDTLPDK